MKYEIWREAKFKKDFRRLIKRGKDGRKMMKVIGLLAEGRRLPMKYRDHALKGNWEGFRDCHVESDWVLIYRIDGEELILVLTRTGSHSDLSF